MDPEVDEPPPAEISPALWRELGSSQRLGLIGPSSLAQHVGHAVGYHDAVATVPATVADLGPGGGIPALVLAELWPQCHFTLIDTRERAVARLEVIVARLGWSDRVTVWLGPAETAGRSPSLRGHFDMVTARGFGPPAMTAECGAPLLRSGGLLVVSEPPGAAPRWPAEELAALGLHRVDSEPGSYVVLEARWPCPDRYPRRPGLPRKAPLW